jgi:hypothetical protein
MNISFLNTVYIYMHKSSINDLFFTYSSSGFYHCIKWKGRGEKMEHFFTYDNRLGIKIPALEREWTFYSEKLQQDILLTWESIRGQIPDKIQSLEKSINQKQAALEDEANFIRSCELNSEIGELASIINDLWIWYRTNEEISKKVHG